MQTLNRAQRRAQKHSKARRVTRPTPGTLLFSRELQDMCHQEIQAAAAFRGGYATPWHFDFLLEGIVMCAYAASDKSRENPDTQMQQVCEAATMAVQNIRDRYDRIGKLGATGEEMAMLELYANEAADFWPRQSVRAYRNALERTSGWKRTVVGQAKDERKAA